MKKMVCLLAVSVMLSNMATSRDFDIGEERVESVFYPKASISVDYSTFRKFHGFADDTLRINLENRFDAAILFEAGLYRYFNAGAIFGGSFSNMKKGEPLDLRLGLFAKPFFPIGDRFAIFTRFAGGIAVHAALYPSAIEFYDSKDEEKNMGRVYKGQGYYNIPYGGFGSATIGAEYFIFSRLGLAFEWGIRTTLLHGERSVPFILKNDKDVPGAPSSFNFMNYEMPFSLTLHAIF